MPGNCTPNVFCIYADRPSRCSCAADQSCARWLPRVAPRRNPSFRSMPSQACPAPRPPPDRSIGSSSTSTPCNPPGSRPSASWPGPVLTQPAFQSAVPAEEAVAVPWWSRLPSFLPPRREASAPSVVARLTPVGRGLCTKIRRPGNALGTDYGITFTRPIEHPRANALRH